MDFNSSVYDASNIPITYLPILPSTNLYLSTFPPIQPKNRKIKNHIKEQHV